MWIETFNEMRKNSGMSLDELCAKSGVPKGTLTKITSGVTKAPALETMRSLVYAMGYTLDDLDKGLDAKRELNEEERAYIKKYRALDFFGKKAVESVLNIEYERIFYKETDKESKESNVQYFPFLYFRQASSAGFGDWADSEYAEELLLVKRPPLGASFIIPVNGNSMEPTYPDGCKVFVRPQNEIRKGQVGIFYMDGKMWIKELGHGELISHNRDKYPPVKMTKDIICQGLVLGICDKSYFER